MGLKDVEVGAEAEVLTGNIAKFSENERETRADCSIIETHYHFF